VRWWVVFCDHQQQFINACVVDGVDTNEAMQRAAALCRDRLKAPLIWGIQDIPEHDHEKFEPYLNRIIGRHELGEINLPIGSPSSATTAVHISTAQP
jgi:hypothetical protein